MNQHGLKPEQISFVVCSHGHIDHVGNNNLFTNAIHIVCYDVCVGEQYMLHQFDKVEFISYYHYFASVVVMIRKLLHSNLRF